MSERAEQKQNMTIDDLRESVDRAMSVNDAELTIRYAEALDQIDTTEAQALSARSKAYAYRLLGRYDEALAHNDRAMALYEEIDDRHGVASVLSNIGIINLLRDEARLGIGVLQRAMALFAELGHEAGVASMTATIGTALLHLGEYNQALENYLKAMEIYERTNNRFGSANTLSNIGLLYHNMGDFPQALHYMDRGLALHEENSDEHGAANVLSNIGMTYWNTGDYVNALDYLYRALEIKERLGDRNGMANINLMIGNVHGSTQNHDESLSYGRRALELYQEIGVRSGIAKALLNLAGQYAAQSDIAAAIDAFQQSLDISEDLDDQRGREQAMANLAQMYLVTDEVEKARFLLQTLEELDLKIPESIIDVDVTRSRLLVIDGKLDDANATLLQALESAVRIGYKEHQANIHRQLRDLAQKRNDFPGYIEHNEAADRITNEIRGQEATRKLAMHAATQAFRSERAEHEKHKALLYNTMPRSIADRVLRGEQVNDSIDEACVMFLDLVGFTTMSSTMEAHQVVDVLGRLFTMCDEICARHQVMKIKTIGDSYMAASFGDGAITEHAARITLAAQEIMSAIQNSNVPLQARIGLHCGPVQAGIIGTERMQYDVWGDTVNVASRMESTGGPGRIHVSEQFMEILVKASFPIPDSPFPKRVVDVKGKGPMTTYFLDGLT